MASLLDLPNEIILQVAEELVGDTRALADLCLTCHLVWPIVREALYSAILLDNPPYQRYGVLRLVRTLLERPERAYLIKNLSMHLRESCRESIFADHWYTKEKAILEEIQKFLGKNSVEDSKCDQVQGGCYRSLLSSIFARNSGYEQRSAFGGVVLALAPNVQELDLKILQESWTDKPGNDALLCTFVDSDWLQEILHASSLLPNIQNITRLRIPFSNTNYLELDFKSLKTLEIDLIMEGDSGHFTNGRLISRQIPPLVRNYTILDKLVLLTDWTVLFPSRKSPVVIELLTILHCAIRSVQIVLARSPTNDRSPTYDHLYWGRKATFGSIISDIRIIENSIEEFAIDYWIENSLEKRTTSRPFVFDPNYLTAASPMTSLTSSRNWKSLGLHQSALVPVNYKLQGSGIHINLPQNLECLTILCPNEDLIPWLHDLSECLSSKYQHLRQITIGCRWNYGKSKNWIDHQLDELRQDLDHDDVTLKVIDDLPFPWKVGHCHRARGFEIFDELTNLDEWELSEDALSRLFGECVF